MLNKKRLLAMGMTTAMIAASLAGCSGNSSSGDAGTSSAPESSAEENSSATDEEPSTDDGNAAGDAVAPDYAVEAGKVIDFEDGSVSFIKQNEANLSADAATMEIVDFNGSKALKVSPNSDVKGKVFELGLDVNALLGDKVGDAASVSMQIGVEAADGNFYPCTGYIKQNFGDTNTTGWVTYLEEKNPNTVTVTFANAYDPSTDNVLVIEKDANGDNNGDKAFDSTEKYSTMYIDNIVFFDASGNPIEVDTGSTFAAESYGSLDWSNLIEVKDQVVIEGFADKDMNGWSQGAWHQNIQEVPVQDTDEEGEPLVDENGDPVYKQKVDDDGNPVVDENGDPVYETETVGDVDWTSIMKPGTVFTLYYTSEMTEDLNHYIWFVMTFADGTKEKEQNDKLGWARIKDAPHAADNGLEPGDENSVFRTNDSNNMAQITFEEIEQFIKDVYGVEDVDWSGNYSIQAEAGMAWSLSAVTYALDQEY